MENYNELLEILDIILADYGNQELEFPSKELEEKYHKETLTEEDAEEIFNYNNGDIDSCLEYEECEE